MSCQCVSEGCLKSAALESYFQLSEKKKGRYPGQLESAGTEPTTSLHLHLHFVVPQLLVYPAFLLALTDHSCSCEHKYV